MPHILFQREADDSVPDIARADRLDCNRVMGGTLMSVDIIQYIPRPTNVSDQTNFPTIAFRSAVHEPPRDDAVKAPCEYVEPEEGGI
jgi:hypothetical protein